MNTTDITTQAYEMGYEHGKAVGSWAFDGNTSRETYARVLQGYEDGDPEVLDMAPAPLSGEWADEPTIGDVLGELGVPDVSNHPDNGVYDQVPDEYERGFAEGYWDEVIRVAQYQLSD